MIFRLCPFVRVEKVQAAAAEPVVELSSVRPAALPADLPSELHRTARPLDIERLLQVIIIVRRNFEESFQSLQMWESIDANKGKGRSTNLNRRST